MINPKAKSVLAVLKEVGSEFSKDKCTQLAAALAYYSIFSLAPLLIILIALVGFIWGGDAVRGELQGQISNAVGENAAEAIETMVASTSEPSGNVWASIVGGLTLLFGASGVFEQLKQSLNQIWGTPRPAGGGVMGFVTQRLLSFAMILVIGFLLLISLVLTAVVAALGGWLERTFFLSPAVLQVVSFVIFFGVVTLLFAMIFMSNAGVGWRLTQTPYNHRALRPPT